MTNTAPSPSTGLKPITTRPGLREYLGELRDRSEYMRAVPLGELRAQNLDTVLGNLWFFLTPLLQTGVFFLIFGVLFHAVNGLRVILMDFAPGMGRYQHVIFWIEVAVVTVVFIPAAVITLAPIFS